MTITDDDVRAIDDAARVLRRVAEDADDTVEFSVDHRGVYDLAVGIPPSACIDGDLDTASPGEALRRLVGR